MSKAFYTRMHATATRLLNQYGHSIELINANKTVLDTYQGLKGTVRVENTPQSVLEASEATVYITTGTRVPTVDDYLNMDGSIWKIIWVDEVRPTDITILFTIFVARGA